MADSVDDHRGSGGKTRNAAEDGARTVEEGAEKASRSPWATGVARVGFVFVGLLHVLIAWLAVQVALGGSNNHADESGAVEQIASAPGGPVILWGGTLCCAALALWMFFEFFAEWRRHGKPTKGLGPGGTGVAYAALAVLFATFALGNRKNSSQQSREITATLLAVPLGVVVLIIAGLVLLGAAGYFGFRGFTQSFLGKDAQPEPSVPGWVKIVGSVGYVAKGVALAVLGVLVFVATANHNPQQQTGLDGALKSLAGQPFGGWILGAVAIGLACYGVYSAARAKYAHF
ncbi:DUF1206 domain-containing protein [Sinomonas terrae]|uniref:DUF1206 domain-containing protein n=1 Tax=Sinomonas terrae TaxID=2908838 RepID=A0ABS9U5K9_9MICC|nr:DUF1206 domain-containing protein [Sinomonas terrae]MCH6471978.1 DUF1206 domain-containing protein [Sinomonas terrae]